MMDWSFPPGSRAKLPSHSSCSYKLSPSLPLLVTPKPEISEVLNACFWEQKGGRSCYALSSVRRGWHSPLTTSPLSRPAQAWFCYQIRYIWYMIAPLAGQECSVWHPSCHSTPVAWTCSQLDRPSEAIVGRPASLSGALPRHEKFTLPRAA